MGRKMTQEQKEKMAAGRARKAAERAKLKEVGEELTGQSSAAPGSGQLSAPPNISVATVNSPIPEPLTSEPQEPNKVTIPQYTECALSKADTDYFVMDPSATVRFPTEPEKNIRIHEIPLTPGGVAMPFKFVPGRPTRMPREYALRFLRDPFTVLDMDGNKLETPPELHVLGDNRGVVGRKLAHNEVVASLGELTTQALFNRCKRHPNSDTIGMQSSRDSMVGFLVGIAAKQERLTNQAKRAKPGRGKPGFEADDEVEEASAAEIAHMSEGLDLGSDAQIVKAA